jgi:hypothetical protein
VLNAQGIDPVFSLYLSPRLGSRRTGAIEGVYMKSTSGLACVFIMGCISCSGQTNSCPIPSFRFFLAPVQLRSEARPECAKSEQAASAPATPATSAGITSLNAAVGDGDFHSSVLREGEFYLTRTEGRSDNAVVRFVDEVFTPEVIHLRKVSVSSPIVTIIKRKNPLCLLSGLSAQSAPSGDGQIVFRLLELSW